ncbi:lipase maturation factor family protein [Flavihumibacter solisilvae]|uniref:lipase maturation factor family protein n=1 Tax=Flavihumibacter solisilvae TaxID=1349421 RepID=UPI000AB7349E|nr:lipase maturation factor family protein [Flavihumibacter solisilvae]
MILRLLGVVYAVAFLVALDQVIPLIGSNGLLPVGNYLDEVALSLGSRNAGFWRLPSIFWFGHSDSTLLVVAWIGFVLACIVICGFANAPLLFLLWMLYMSFVHVGQDWYGYGWEIQLLETGFLAIFLCPLFDARPFPRRPPPFFIIVLLRWLACRIMLGAGLIKLRNDSLWLNGTALYYHFETQPIPGPLSRWFHFLPHPILKAGTWFNFLAELVAPLFVFWPRTTRHVAGIVIVLFQFTIILSGNLSFLNWLTIVPALACFDDGFWSKVLPRPLVQRAEAAIGLSEDSRPMIVTSYVITLVIGSLSILPVFNMLSSRQVMNTSFEPFDLVNTYGAFGWVGRERLNVVFEGTSDTVPGDSAHWKEYPYKGLPVALDKRPPQIAPYHLRFDWQMWFAAMADAGDYPWTLSLTDKLLHNDPLAIQLFASNPFPGKPPRYVRAILYRYSFLPSANKEGKWWKREQLAIWLPALSANDPRLP